MDKETPRARGKDARWFIQEAVSIPLLVSARVT
jgi:hypothetical protein